MLRVLLPVLALAATGALAQPAEVTISGDRALDVAADLVARGRLDQADEILRRLAEGDPAALDMIRLDALAAEIAAARGEHERAVFILGNVLDHDPSLATLRLRMARSLFELRQDRRAAHHLRLARPQLSGEDSEQARRLLAAIEARRVFSLRFAAALLPDSNVNTATSEATQVIGGIEQTLQDDGALARSGLGLSTRLTAMALPKITSRLRGEARADVALTDQSNIDFDYLTYGGEAGLRWQGGRLRASLLGTAEAQRFGGEPYAEGFGGRVRLTAALDARTQGGVEFGVTDTDFVRDAYDGMTYDAAFSLQRAAGTATLLGVQAAGARHDARDPAQSYWRVGGALSATREVAGGVTLTAAPGLVFRTYDEAAAFFGQRREDLTVSGTLAAAKRDFQLHGFAPQLSYTYVRNDSTLGLYDYERHRVSLGLTRAF
ncbi:surface lipoprotein assembly modifier [Parvularcula dongshanensis]|uniref:Surface lipoprotein assembly modifier C-terminal domain-containing protein n=1 Tax=Parvularcula dongshanensis TaxID=1173995 RepID=A0A840I0B4_9PROT|nr:surface lipoprotein assembly modifier [Parvularcula dongshanensis]MBB4658137.1 hypothetical protein [Parvularcula dongshanensis]